MQLMSADKRTILEISRAESGGEHPPYRMRVVSSDSVGGFSGENRSVHFLNVDAFRQALDSFLRAHRGSAALEGTDDCRVELFRWNAKGDIGVRYTVATQFMEGEATEYSKVALSGRFQLPGEFAERMAAELRKELP